MEHPQYADTLRRQIVQFEQECRSRAPNDLVPVDRDKDQREQIRAMGYFE